MSTTRKRTRSTRTSYPSHNTAGKILAKSHEAQPSLLLPSRASADDGHVPVSPFLKKRRSPNAFILFRSFMIANKLYPPELKHQNDLSCYVAEIWRNSSEEYRATFFRMAEEAKWRFEIETSGGAVPPKRTRARKPRSSNPDDSGALRYPLQSPSSDLGSRATSHPFLSLPSECLAPTYNSVPRCNITSLSPCAPQPIHPIPPSLFYWGQEADELKHDAVDLDSPGCESPPSLHSRWTSAATYHRDATYPDTSMPHELGFLESPEMDMPWPMDYSLDIGTALQQQPPFGVYLFP